MNIVAAAIHAGGLCDGYDLWLPCGDPRYHLALLHIVHHHIEAVAGTDVVAAGPPHGQHMDAVAVGQDPEAELQRQGCVGGQRARSDTRELACPLTCRPASYPPTFAKISRLLVEVTTL